MKQSESYFSRYYENRNEVLHKPPPTSVTLKAALLLLEATCLPLHLQEYVERVRQKARIAEGEEGDWTTIKPQTSFHERKHTEDQSHIADEENDSFLIPASYIENWIQWAFHQPLEEEKARLRIALSIACEIYGFEKPEEFFSSHKARCESREHHPIVVKPQPRILKSYTSEAPDKINTHMKQHKKPSEPGPIDATSLSMLGHPLLLRPGVTLKNMMGNKGDKENDISLNALDLSKMDFSTGNAQTTEIIPKKVENEATLGFKRSSSLLDDISSQHHNEGVHNKYNGEVTEDIECVAVPANFYELLASIHGVVCKDGKGTTFEAGKKRHGLEHIIHHHIISKSNAEQIEGNGEMPLPSSKTNKTTHKTSRKKHKKGRKKPIEFRRKVITSGLTEKNMKGHEASLSYSSALSSGRHNQRMSESKKIELYPIRCFYSIVDASGKLSNENTERYHKWKGFMLLSSTLDAKEAIASIITCVAPGRKRECKRCWDLQCHLNATNLGDRYELIDSFWPNNVRYISAKGRSDTFCVGQWAKVQSEIHQLPNTLHLLIETRSSPSVPWVREDLVLENRIRNGDFVDAMSLSGKYHEAMAIKVTDKSIKVHFLGLGRKFDRIIPRKAPVQNSSQILPLWSQTRQWRDELKVGDEVEVREAASLIQRPKWYPAIIKFVGKEDENIQETSGGADLDVFDIGGNGVNHPILLLNRSQQVLVEVADERINSSSQSQSQFATKKLNVDPPYIRWVNLYGEEICMKGTHIKPTLSDQKPATLIFSHNGSAPVEIMRPNNGINGCGFVRESLKGVPAAPGSVGLHNLGNTCFLNSIIQCLNHIEPITKYFLNGTYRNDLNKSNPLGSGGRIAESYACLLEDIWSGEYSAIAPRNIKHVIGLFAAQFRNYQQHDSQEFCSFLMDGLHEDLNRVKDKLYTEDVEGEGLKDHLFASKTWKTHLLRHDSFIVDSCQGLQRNFVKCPACGKESVKFDVYSTLSLPLPQSENGGVISIYHCLEQFTMGEQLDEENAWYCSACKKHVRALKTMKLWSIPDILIIHLKRFTFRRTKRGGLVRSKLKDSIDFPVDKLDMETYVQGPIDARAPPHYKLLGISEHSGSSANSGHYTATVRNSKDGKWYRCNDSHVGVTTGDAAKTGGAYLLFYQRIRGASKWAGMGDSDQNGTYSTQNIDEDGFTTVVPKKQKRKSPYKGIR